MKSGVFAVVRKFPESHPSCLQGCFHRWLYVSTYPAYEDQLYLARTA